MKRYTRKGLIRFYEKLPPRSRPCRSRLCPIATYLHMESSAMAFCVDPDLATVIDDTPISWIHLTAARIVKIAKAAPHEA